MGLFSGRKTVHVDSDILVIGGGMAGGVENTDPHAAEVEEGEGGGRGGTQLSGPHT